MSCGCPVVCTDDGGNRDYVTTANAITVKRNVQAIRQGVHIVLKNKDLRRRLKREGLKTARDPKFTWDNVTKKLESVLEGILKHGRVV
jgi:glycosyltransferase involved in cell wall biosynthesis